MHMIAAGSLAPSPDGPSASIFRQVLLAGCALLAFVATGCAHYRLGTAAHPDFTSIYIAPVRNDAGVPQATALVTTALRDAFLKDGRLSLAAHPTEADAVLTVVLTAYSRNVTTARAGDTGLARKFDLHLQANATLTDASGETVWFAERPLPVARQIFTDSGQLQAEYQTLPHLADEVADRAVHAVLDVW